MRRRLENLLAELDVAAKIHMKPEVYWGGHMSESLFDKYGGVEISTPWFESFTKEKWRTEI